MSAREVILDEVLKNRQALRGAVREALEHQRHSDIRGYLDQALGKPAETVHNTGDADLVQFLSQLPQGVRDAVRDAVAQGDDIDLDALAE